VPRLHNSIPVSIIGAGKVGSTLALLLHRSGYPIVSVISKSKKSAKRLAQRVQCKVFSDSLSALSTETRFLLVTSPEETLAELIRKIGAISHIHYRGLFCAHVSGSETSDVFMPLKKRGAVPFSLHPIQTFPINISPAEQAAKMPGITYGFEGPQSALPFARRIVRNLQGSIIVVPKEKKILYHIACVFASNYPLVMLGAAEQLFLSLHTKVQRRHVQPLVEASIENAFQLGALKALTGPAIRGSLDTIRNHIRTLKKINPHYVEVYRQSGLLAVQLARKSGRLSPRRCKTIENVFQKT
jgi:predicted short-subunit dehydrogenase-like oxidoreductase (DUF2520 family)